MKAVILAGGVGSRLYPLSTEECPKQFLPLFNEKSLLANTVERVAPVTDKVYISTRACWVPRMQKERQFTHDINFIVEPCGRNTGPAIAYCISKFADDDIVGFFPSDHFISPEDVFAEAVLKADRLVREKDAVVLFGINPTEPCTEFGYIHHSGSSILSFKEKPDQETAEKYLKTGNHLWNSGMFFFRVGKMKALFKSYAKKISDWLERDRSDRGFEQLEKVSIDYAVMEKAKGTDLQVVPCSFIWSDLGTFDAVEKMFGPTVIVNLLKNFKSFH